MKFIAPTIGKNPASTTLQYVQEGADPGNFDILPRNHPEAHAQFGLKTPLKLARQFNAFVDAGFHMNELENHFTNYGEMMQTIKALNASHVTGWSNVDDEHGRPEPFSFEKVLTLMDNADFYKWVEEQSIMLAKQSEAEAAIVDDIKKKPRRSSAG